MTEWVERACIVWLMFAAGKCMGKLSEIVWLITDTRAEVRRSREKGQ